MNTEEKNEQELKKEISHLIGEIQRKRNIAESASEYGLKRNPYVRLREKGMMNSESS